jgi:hypothetical protein
MTVELLKLSDCSVIVVDWSGGSGPPYPQAVANIRLVGAMTAHLINNLIVSMLHFSHILLIQCLNHVTVCLHLHLILKC